MKSKLKIVALIIVVILLITSCAYLIIQFVRAKNQTIQNPVLTLEIENYGNIKIELYPEYAPNTVKNIIKLAEKGYYDGKVFYGKDDISLYVGRNSEGNIDYPKLSTLEETVAEEDDYEYEIEGEFAANNFNTNTLKHEKGTVSLIRADYTQLSADLLKESFNSGSSQFTILTQDERSLNGLYAAFGKVVEGMEIVEQISNIQVAQTDEENTQGISIKAFSTFPVIKKATVETFGYNYGFPKVNKAFDYDGYIQDLLTQYYKTTEE